MKIRFGDSSQQPQHFPVLCNTEAGGVFSNVRENLARGYEKFVEAKTNNRAVCICGSGPSLSSTLENIRAMQKRGAFVLALNGAARYLNENGIKSDALAMVDSRPDNAHFVEKKFATEAWMASQCHPDVVAKAESTGMKIVLWHPGIPGMEAHIPAATSLRMGGGYTVGLCAISCAYVAGFREIHLFGYDSSHREDQSHAFRQAMNDTDDLVNAVIDSQTFTCSTNMAAQASLFLEFTKHVLKDGAEIHVHGDGLIPALWRSDRRKIETRVLTAVYDLGVSPPTYDFIGFIAEAERYRIANNFDVLDVSFQPGPMHGFRSDDLPPDVTARHGMLWRVCVGIARLLPSVRNVAVLGERISIGGDVFPLGWADNNPVSHYGTIYLRGAEPMLRASDAARALAKARKSPYATITLRASSYWPERNSNALAWTAAARWLQQRGIRPLLIPDTDGLERVYDGFDSCSEAAFDVDIRAALYEGAVINLGTANGPMYLCPFLKARYIIFNIGDGKTPATSTEFLLSHGVTRGDPNPFGGDGKVVWEPDTAEVILRELAEFDVQRKEKIV